MSMTATKGKINNGGRPWLTEEQKTQRKSLLLAKIEPYLMSGLSINKALKEAKIYNSEFYKYMREDRLFGEKIARFKNFISVLVCKILTTELIDIAQRQKENHVQGLTLSREDRKFLWRFALHSNLTYEEYGRRTKVDSFDYEAEIYKVYKLLNTLPNNIC